MKNIIKTLIVGFVFNPGLIFCNEIVIDFDNPQDNSTKITDIVKQIQEQTLEEDKTIRLNVFPDVNPQKTCEIHLKTIPLILNGNIKYARASYRISETCEPYLESIEYSVDISTMTPVQEPISQLETTSILDYDTNKSIIKSESLDKGNYSCTVTAWEQDVNYGRMIQLQNITTWTTDNSNSILHGRVTARSSKFFQWWYFLGKPSAKFWWVIKPIQMHTLGNASFYCKNGPWPCEGDTPKYPMTITAHEDIFSNGDCKGTANFDGKIMPGSMTGFEVTRYADKQINKFN